MEYVVKQIQDANCKNNYLEVFDWLNPIRQSLNPKINIGTMEHKE